MANPRRPIDVLGSVITPPKRNAVRDRLEIIIIEGGVSLGGRMHAREYRIYLYKKTGYFLHADSERFQQASEKWAKAWSTRGDECKSLLELSCDENIHEYP